MAFGAIDISYVHTVRRMQREMHDDCSIPIPGMLVPPLLLLLPMCIVEIVKINMHELLKWMNALTPPHIHSLCEREGERAAPLLALHSSTHTQCKNISVQWRMKKSCCYFSFFLFHLCAFAVARTSARALFFVWLQDCCNLSRTTTTNSKEWTKRGEYHRNEWTKRAHIHSMSIE